MSRKKERGDLAEYTPGSRREGEPSLFESTQQYLAGAEERLSKLTPLEQISDFAKRGIAAQREIDQIIEQHGSADLATAHARDSDPETSHAAADKATLKMNASRRAVLECFQRAYHYIADVQTFGHRQVARNYSIPQFTHDDLVIAYNLNRERFGWPPQTASGIRSRCRDLVRMDKVRQIGQTVNERGSKTAIWGLIT